MTGPLDGLRVIEMAGIGPAPFCAMILADLGADVVRIDRPADVPSTAPADPPPRPLQRGKRSIAVDLKARRAPEVVLRLVEGAQVFLEGFRPGVAERLGIGPAPAMERNPSLVYVRVTGFGQDGPLARAPGHDINYLATSGVLDHLGAPDTPPLPPLNLLADFGGGGMVATVGVLSALFETARSGVGQVVDASMVDGSALLMTMIHGMVASGSWTLERGRNILDGGAPFYRTYAAADGRWVAVGANEPQFYAELLAGLGLDHDELPDQMDRSRWPELHDRFAAVFRTRTRDEWSAVFAGRETCVSPVLTTEEARTYDHNAARDVLFESGGVVQASPAPRFSRTPARRPAPPVHPGHDTDAVLLESGFDATAIDALRAERVVA